ncbi:hypothetical protein PFNF135_00427 [Plasmodium falciparum NF135/5.C10]|uniref:Uncharacterized protein n=2 Tax=Plasmodium falciparum TaxID=5833 RepID=A0A024VC85_PLAFA|nr:hypothetical protein PFFVO_00393 [Plasmodium falciparum Vietnam Oak-Knoll (FVO)]ETW45098.1 hypothetical protein PFNF135_00427 [Plasmodium falciparum NF135/5.C10]
MSPRSANLYFISVQIPKISLRRLFFMCFLSYFAANNRSPKNEWLALTPVSSMLYTFKFSKLEVHICLRRGGNKTSLWI